MLDSVVFFPSVFLISLSYNGEYSKFTITPARVRSLLGDNDSQMAGGGGLAGVLGNLGGVAAAAAPETAAPAAGGDAPTVGQDLLNLVKARLDDRHLPAIVYARFRLFYGGLARVDGAGVG